MPRVIQYAFKIWTLGLGLPVGMVISAVSLLRHWPDLGGNSILRVLAGTAAIMSATCATAFCLGLIRWYIAYPGGRDVPP